MNMISIMNIYVFVECSPIAYPLLIAYPSVLSAPTQVQVLWKGVSSLIARI